MIRHLTPTSDEEVEEVINHDWVNHKCCLPKNIDVVTYLFVMSDIFFEVTKDVFPVCLFVLRFYGPVNPMGSCRARSVYLTTRLLGRLSPLSG